MLKERDLFTLEQLGGIVMRRRTMFAAAGFLAILALAAASSKEKEPIGKLRSEIIRAFAGQSANAMAMLWAEDGELVKPSGEKAGGRDQVESIFADTLRGADAASRLKVSIEEVRFPEEGVAEVDCTYKLVGVRGVDAKETSGIYTVVLAKKDGKWYITKASPK